MKRQILTTKDGSKTIHFPEWNESYHSQHGAITEALHVYIKSGLDYRIKLEPLKSLSVLEMGFGTGLNAYLTYKYARENGLSINYSSIEKYPMPDEEVSLLNYAEESDTSVFEQLHTVPWDEFISIAEHFQLKKLQMDIDSFKTDEKFDVIFYDAFGPRVQPHLWNMSILETMYSVLNPNGVWVTYSCKGSVRRALTDLGFYVEKIPGPPGKREMLRAIKRVKS